MSPLHPRPMLLTVFAALCFAACLGAYREADTQFAAPKNIIFMISDGCGFNQVKAAAFYQHGATEALVYEGFPVRLACSTYPSGSGYIPSVIWSAFNNVKSGETDSAAAATALSTGVKTSNGRLGIGPDGTRLRNVLELAEGRGKRTGVITTVHWSHATPAGFVAHNTNRGDYVGIAQEMLYVSTADVIMGAGHPFYNDNGESSATAISYNYVGGENAWNHVKQGKVGADADGDGISDPWTLIEQRSEFQALATGPTPKRVLGTARAHQTIQQRRAGDAAVPYSPPRLETVPTLAEMVRAALNVLDDDPDGLFLMVEGGAVDWACHSNQAGRLIEEQIDFNQAIAAVVEWVEAGPGWEQTLVIVTADHETGYLTGPGSDPTWQPLQNRGAGNVPGLEWHSGGHTNSLVPLYAKGAGSEHLAQRAIGSDPVYGAYLDNTDVSQTIIALWDVPPTPALMSFK